MAIPPRSPTSGGPKSRVCTFVVSPLLKGSGDQRCDDRRPSRTLLVAAPLGLLVKGHHVELNKGRTYDVTATDSVYMVVAASTPPMRAQALAVMLSQQSTRSQIDDPGGRWTNSGRIIGYSERGRFRI